MERIFFYPCAGRDIRIFLRLFAHTVDTFWFADTKYARGNPIRWSVPSLKLPKWNPVFEEELFLESKATEIPVAVKRYQFLNERFNKTVTINFAAGHAIEVFERLPVENVLAVFCHRGDSTGEGGSDTFWLRDRGGATYPQGQLVRVLDSLTNGSLVISDGSNAEPQFSSYHRDSEAPNDAHRTQKAFSIGDKHFECVGAIDNNYGPTFVWQVTKPQQT